MGSRWREENYFRYGRAHFALDALDTYAVTPEDLDRKVPNPAKKKAAAAVKTAKKNLADAQAAREAKLTALRNPAPGQETLIANQALAGSIPGHRRPPQARRRPGRRQGHPREDPAVRAQPGHGPPGHRDQAHHPRHPDGAYNAETILARALDGAYARAGEEAYALIREALTTSGDIIPADGTLTIRLDPLSAPRRTRALVGL